MTGYRPPVPLYEEDAAASAHDAAERGALQAVQSNAVAEEGGLQQQQQQLQLGTQRQERAVRSASMELADPGGAHDSAAARKGSWLKRLDASCKRHFSWACVAVRSRLASMSYILITCHVSIAK